MKLRFAWLGMALAILVGCGDDDRPGVDAGADGALPPDSAMMDTSMPPDSAMMDGGGTDTGMDAMLGMDAGPSHCSDGVVSGDETGVDCGGPTCRMRCPDDDECVISSDCESGVCIGFICQPPRCSDGVENGTETGRDCGGDCPTGCPLGSGCGEMSDCADGVCADMVCQAMHCFDDVRSGDESDVDCGGSDCIDCPAGSMCMDDTDCASGSCMMGFCLTPECRNGTMDGDEAGVDCGGSDCPGCDDGTTCTMDRDCRSDRCDGDTCTSCNDDTQNGDESDVDCGGSCGGCPGDFMCTTGADCASGECRGDMTCTGPSIYYGESFETDDGGWTASAGSSWQHGRPGGSIIDMAGEGLNAWVTNLTGDYMSSEDSWIESPPIDLRGATSDPVLVFRQIYVTESCCDEGWVEVSIDGGTMWTKVGAAGTGSNWYNDTTNDWWDGSSGGEWRIVSNRLTGTAGERDVRIRMRFSSDGSVTNEGFGVDDVIVREPSPADLEVTLTPVPETCGVLIATIRNIGDMDAGAFRIETDLDGSTAMENVSGGLTAGDSITRMIDGTSASMVTVTVTLMDDPDLSNNVASFTSSMLFMPIPPTGYSEDFESGDGMWSTTGTNNSWAWGRPAGTTIDAAASGVNAWVTNPAGNYNSSERSQLLSPCFDASAAGGDLLLSFQHNFITEGCCDEGWWEYTIDGGTTWQKLDGGAAMNWYNDTTNDWWDGTSSGWRMASAVIPGSAGATAVRVRHHFSSDGSVVREGFAVDDVRLTPLQTDLEVTIGPGLGCGEALVTIRNVGGNLVRRTTLSTRIDGGAPMNEVIREDIPFGGTVTRTVGMAGASNITVSINTMGDTNAANDTAMIDVAPVALGAGYSSDFEADEGGWVATGTNSSWAWGNPVDDFITAAAGGTNAWVTNLSGNYNADENSYLLSPCFDFSAAASDPTISFNHIYRTQACCDEGWLEVQIDGGAWTKVGTEASGTNWYNDAANDWWDGSSGVAGGWVNASHPITGSAGASAVRLRFVMSSDDGGANDGFGVDDVSIAP